MDNCLIVINQDFLDMEASLWRNEKSRVLLKVGCLPYAVGKQPSIPLIILGKNGRRADNDDVLLRVLLRSLFIFKRTRSLTFFIPISQVRYICVSEGWDGKAHGSKLVGRGCARFKYNRLLNTRDKAHKIQLVFVFNTMLEYQNCRDTGIASKSGASSNLIGRAGWIC